MGAKGSKMPGQEDPETGQKYLSNSTFFLSLFMLIFLLVITHYVFHASKSLIEHMINGKLNYKHYLLITVILLISYILLERSILKPFRSFI